MFGKKRKDYRKKLWKMLYTKCMKKHSLHSNTSVLTKTCLMARNDAKISIICCVKKLLCTAKNQISNITKLIY